MIAIISEGDRNFKHHYNLMVPPSHMKLTTDRNCVFLHLCLLYVDDIDFIYLHFRCPLGKILDTSLNMLVFSGICSNIHRIFTVSFNGQIITTEGKNVEMGE